MSGLATKPLQRLCKLIVDCPHSTPKWTDKGFVVLRNQNIRFGRLDLSNPSYTDEEHYNYRIKRGVPSFGDIVLTREAPMGEVCAIPKDLKCCLGQRMVLIRPDPKKLDFTYLLYALQGKSIQHQIGWSKGTGTTVSNLRIPILKTLEIPDLPLKEQREVAHKLKTLDDKIALNRRTNATLEAMAQALFKSWFVDFDPVIDNALDAGHALPDALATRVARRKAVRASGEYAPLAAEVRALFPASFAWSEALGKFVPRGWGVKRLEDVTFINPKEKLPKNTIAPYIGMKQLPESGYSIDDSELKPYAGGAKFKQGDVLVARITPCLENGKTGIVDFLEPDVVGFGSTEFIVLRAKDNTPMSWVACLARNSVFKRHLVRSMVGSSGRQRVQPDAVTGYLMSLPSDDSAVWKKFAELTQKSFALFSSNRAESATLSTLRDVLLGELIG